MPKKKIEADKSEIVRVRVSTETRERCTKARIAGAHKDDAESAFMGYLVKLGIAKYEKAILPLESGEDEAVSGAKKRNAS